MRTPEPAVKSLYKSQPEEDCVYVHLHPEITVYGANNASFYDA